LPQQKTSTNERNKRFNFDRKSLMYQISSFLPIKEYLPIYLQMLGSDAPEQQLLHSSGRIPAKV
jgi:hypothetical protein